MLPDVSAVAGLAIDPQSRVCLPMQIGHRQCSSTLQSSSATRSLRTRTHTHTRQLSAWKTHTVAQRRTVRTRGEVLPLRIAWWLSRSSCSSPSCFHFGYMAILFQNITCVLTVLESGGSCFGTLTDQGRRVLWRLFCHTFCLWPHVFLTAVLLEHTVP